VNAPRVSEDELLAAAGAIDAQRDQVDSLVAEVAATPTSAPGAPDFAVEARGCVDLFCSIMFPLYPSLEAVYTPEARARVVAALAPVLAKHQFTLAALFGKWGPEINLAFVALPLVNPSIDAIKADRAARAAERAKEKAAAPSPATVQ
jgi:hypothetical protein